MKPRLDHFYLGDSLDVLKSFDSNSVDLCITSPPYHGQRDYNAKGQLGQEKTIEEYIRKLVTIFREVKRVLTTTGSFFLVIGDYYTTKSIQFLPFRLAWALQFDGWITRTPAIWVKTNPPRLPLTDRWLLNYELVFQFAKSEKFAFYVNEKKNEVSYFRPRINRDRNWQPYSYYFDMQYEPHSEATLKIIRENRQIKFGGKKHKGYGKGTYSGKIWKPNPKGAIPTATWWVGPDGTDAQHFATFPQELAVKIIESAGPPLVCIDCKLPTVGLSKCTCNSSFRQGIVLDPFMGSGTVAMACRQKFMNFVGIDINPDFIEIAKNRVGGIQSCLIES